MYQPPPLLNELIYVSRGSFAAQVADELGLPERRRLDASGETYTADIPSCGCIVVATPGRDSGLRDRLDSLSFLLGIPSFGIELHPTGVTVGPLVRPGETACYACYERRSEQHRPGQGLRLEGSGSLAEGFMRHHVLIAAGFAEQALREAVTPRPGIGGTVRTFDLVTGSVTASATVAVDQCQRCGVRFREGAPSDPFASLKVVAR